MVAKPNRLALLCSKGYLPHILPPAFTSVDYGTHVRDLLKDWANSNVIPDLKSAKKIGSISESEAELISAPKGLHERRIFHLVHPVSHAAQAAVISRNWVTIEKWLKRSKYNFDSAQIVNTTNGRRAISEPSWLAHETHKTIIESTANWVVTTDVNRFFPSIYTHSIAWAAYGKEKVKTNLKKYNGSLADQLDVLTRKCNRNQTIGIPIGPDVSIIIAEILSAYVDDVISKSTNLARSNADRLQDDWHIGSVSREEAEKHLSALRNAYRTVGLDLNGSKTAIYHVSELPLADWRAALSGVLAKKLTRSRLQIFCNTALHLQSKHPRDFVLKYSLVVLMNKQFDDTDIRIVEAFLLKAVVVDPRICEQVCLMLLNFFDQQRPINLERVLARIVPFAENALEIGANYEAIWALYLLRGLKASSVGDRIVQRAEFYEGSTIPLILLDMEEKGKVRLLPKESWCKKLKSSDLWKGEWLLAYEGIRHGWLSKNNVGHGKDPFLKPMLDRNVVFYDPMRNVARVNKLRSNRKPRNYEQTWARLGLWLGMYGTS